MRKSDTGGKRSSNDLPPIDQANHGRAKDDGPGGGYLYRNNALLAADADTREVVDAIDGQYSTKKRVRPDYMAPTRLYRSKLNYIPLDTDRVSLPVPQLVTELRMEGRDGGALNTSPDHVAVVGSHPDPFPATAPRPQTGRITARLTDLASEGSGVKVVIFDSGTDLRHPVLKPHLDTGTKNPGDGEDPAGPTLGLCNGHGTFIAGLVLQHAPKATICVRRAFGENGLVSDAELAGVLLRRTPTDADIVLICCGGPTHDGMAMQATENAINVLRKRRPQTVFVAAAGNDAVDVPYFPAAFTNVIGVAATTKGRTRACFSNYGPWVDACAPGVDLTSTFITATALVPQAISRSGCDPAATASIQEFIAWAIWSGTSFSAPQVAGEIAAEMTRTGVTSAAQAVITLFAGKPPLWDGTSQLGVFFDSTSLAFR